MTPLDGELTVASAKDAPLKPRLHGSWVRGPRLEARDREILRWITRHGVVTADLVARKFFARPERNTYGEWAAKRRIAALSHLGLIVRNGNPLAVKNAPGQQLLRVTRSGANVSDVGLREAPLVVAQLQHALTLVDLTEFLLAQYPGADLTTERELWALEYRRRFRGGPAPKLARIPDAMLRIAAPLGASQQTITIAVELDLSRKDRQAMTSMIARYDQMPTIDLVWWYVKEARVPAVTALVRELRADNRYKVLPVRWLQ